MARRICFVLTCAISLSYSHVADASELPPDSPSSQVGRAPFFTPQMFDVNAGKGADDQKAIQSAIDAAAKLGGGHIFLPAPESGHYNVCLAGLALPTKGSLVMEGSSVATSVRVLPGCSSPPDSVISELPSTGTSQNRIRLENLTVDGYCLARHDIKFAYTRGFLSENVVYRNVAKGGSNVFFEGKLQNGLGYVGFEERLGAGNLLENVNDEDHRCYSSSDDLPNYNLENYASDSDFTGLVAVNARVANFFSFGPGSFFGTGTHGWGSGVFRPEYNFYVKDVHILDGFDADGQTVAAIRVSGYGVIVRNGIFQNVKKPAGTIGILADATSKYLRVYGNALQDYMDKQIVFSSGARDPSDVIEEGMEALK